jgi:hypothetical protein
LTIGLTGVGSTGAVGSVSLAPRIFGLTGVAATGRVGDIVAVYWKPIPDDTNANWQNITGEPSTVWSNLGTNTPVNWQEVTTV